MGTHLTTIPLFESSLTNLLLMGFFARLPIDVQAPEDARMLEKKVAGCVVAGLIALLGAQSAGAAGPYNISVIDAPAGSLTVACGIDVRGNIVGYYTDRTGTHGFSLNNGAFSTIT